jgi:hypothetical protein
MLKSYIFILLYDTQLVDPLTHVIRILSLHKHTFHAQQRHPYILSNLVVC